MTKASASTVGATFAMPVRTRNCDVLPAKMETPTEALAAIQRLPAKLLKSERWQAAVSGLTFACVTKPNDSDVANAAASELRAALLAMGWLG